MTKRRMIDPAFWQSESMAHLTTDQRFLFIGLFSNADDQGRLKGHPALIRNAIFPFDDPSLSKIQDDLNAIEAIGSITQYKAGGKTLIQINGWWDYQSPPWAYPSEIPAPEGWQDRLKYRKDSKVIMDNWNSDGGFCDDDNDEPHQPEPPKQQPPQGGTQDKSKPDDDNPLGKALGNALPKATELELELGIELGTGLEKGGESSGVVPTHVCETPKNAPPPPGPVATKVLEICKLDYGFVLSTPKLKKQYLSTLRFLERKKAGVPELDVFDQWQSTHHWTRGSPPTLTQVGQFWGEFESWIKAGKPEKVSNDNDNKRTAQSQRAANSAQKSGSAGERGAPGSAARAAANASRSR